MPPNEQKGFVTRPQPKIAPKDPETRQDAAKEAFLGVFYDAKTMALDLVDDFRASDRFFKYKAAVIGGWAMLSLMALVVACPSRQVRDEVANSLDARVLIKQVPALDRTITAIYIQNDSGDDWGDTLLKLNNTFTHALADLKAGSKAVVTLEKFSGPSGAQPPPGTRPQKLEITCRQGRTEIDLTQLGP